MQVVTLNKKKIILMLYSNSVSAAQHVIRIQEYYENPVFKKTVFTMGELEAYYTEMNGAFTYCEDWAGFNIPSECFRAFTDGAFNPLTSKEKKVIKAIKGFREPFYVIACGKKDRETIDHELVHAHYALSPFYSVAVNSLLIRSDGLDEAKKELLDWGYTKEVLMDELNAYLATNDERITKLAPKVITDKLIKMWSPHKEKLFKEFDKKRLKK